MAAVAANHQGHAPDSAQGLVSWELETAMLVVNYATLEVSTQAGPLAVAPVQLDDHSLVVAIPANTTPWLPSSLVPLADPVTG